MRTHWNNADDVWEIYVTDPQDPALAEFEFPDEAHGWLRNPEALLRELSVVREVSLKFLARASGFVTAGQVQAACIVPEVDGAPDEIRRPSQLHYIVLGPDGTRDIKSANWIHSICLPLMPRPSRSWDAFPDVSPAFRASCERLSGMSLGGVFSFQSPVILPMDGWDAWRKGIGRLLKGEENIPEPLTSADGQAWVLQKNYYGVFTFLMEPGVLVRADHAGRCRVLDDRTPEEWLAVELEVGGPQQPTSATAD